MVSAVELLRNIGEGRVPDFTGKRVCVIGGGNVSMDATRTALRLGAEQRHLRVPPPGGGHDRPCRGD